MKLQYEHIRVLQGVKILIEERQQYFICNAINERTYHYKWYPESEIKTDLGNAIQKAIAPYGTVGEWLRKKHPKFYQQLQQEYGRDALRTYRIAWIDHILKTGHI